MVLIKVQSFFKKMGHKMTHNKAINYESNQLVFFNRFKFRVTNRRREMFYGYLFISIWVVGLFVFNIIPTSDVFYL